MKWRNRSELNIIIQFMTNGEVQTYHSACHSVQTQKLEYSLN